jgi:hypothetical protein
MGHFDDNVPTSVLQLTSPSRPVAAGATDPPAAALLRATGPAPLLPPPSSSAAPAETPMPPGFATVRARRLIFLSRSSTTCARRPHPVNPCSCERALALKAHLRISPELHDELAHRHGANTLGQAQHCRFYDAAHLSNGSIGRCLNSPAHAVNPQLQFSELELNTKLLGAFLCDSAGESGKGLWVHNRLDVSRSKQHASARGRKISSQGRRTVSGPWEGNGGG